MAIAFAPELPSPEWLCGILLLVLLLAWRFRCGRYVLLGAALGVALAVWHGMQLMANLLPDSLVGRDLEIEGYVISAPELQGRRWRFDFAVSASGLPDRWQLSWYEAPAWVEQLQPGQPLALVVRARPPRSFVNPQGFDYKLWQMRRGVGAIGYIREGQRLDGPVGPVPSFAMRGYLRQWLIQADLVNSDILTALLIGDRSAISDQRWELLRATGTNHLIAISGLHIGLAAAIGYWLGLLFGRGLSFVLPWPAVYMGFAGGAVVAVVYSALAGFALPTQRALAMLLLFYFWRWRGLSLSGMQILAGALVVVGILDPLAVLDAGLWLSFVAVFSLLLMFSGQVYVPRRRWLLWLMSQLTVFIALLVPLWLFFGEVSLIAPVANLLAIALVSLWVVPVLFAAALCAAVWPWLAAWLLRGADLGVQVLWWWLEWLVSFAHRLGASVTVHPDLSGAGGWALALGCLLLLLPRGLRLRPLALVLISGALLVPPERAPHFAMTVLDVGQGLAVVVQSDGETLVYDTGPWFSERFNAGRRYCGALYRREW